MLEWMSKPNFIAPTLSPYNGVQNSSPIPDNTPMFTPRPKIRRSFENYQQLKLDCESIEAWEVLKSEIMASELSTKQKSLLTT